MASPVSLSDMLAAAVSEDGKTRYTITEDWLQGRTTYGGLSAALCLAGVRAVHGDLPPLRSAQIAFVGPAAGKMEVTCRVLRRGRSMSFVEAEFRQSGALATRALFAFGERRASAIDLHRFPMPEVPPPDACETLWTRDSRIAFQHHFDSRLALGDRPVSGEGSGDIAYWFRFREEGGVPAEIAHLAIADGPPPAVMPMFARPVPISSVTWQVDMLSDDVAAEGWRLIRSTAEAAAHGYSGQVMGMWSAGGKPILAGRQMVALFG